MGIKFDPEKPFGRITPPMNGAVYDQGGRLYRQDGTRVYVNENERLREPPLNEDEKPAHQPAPGTPVGGRRGKVTVKAPGEAVQIDPEPSATAPGEKVDQLADWARGARKVPFDTIASEIQERFATAVANETDAAMLLVGNGVVTAEEVTVATVG